jgi:hypothetical protein
MLTTVYPVEGTVTIIIGWIPTGIKVTVHQGHQCDKTTMGVTAIRVEGSHDVVRHPVSDSVKVIDRL